VSEDLAAVVRRLTGRAPRGVGMRGATVLVETGDGPRAVLKAAHDQPGQVAAEVAGLRWLAESGGVSVPEVLGHDEHWLLLRYLPPARPDGAAGRRFGAALARTHAAGAAAFGAPPPGGPARAWIGRAPMANIAGHDWPRWYVEHRVLPYLRSARDGGGLDAAQADVIETAATALLDAPECAGPAVRPARLHGDLWSGNVCWSGSPTRGWVIDPAAHGGHPETDLAMLALFGCPGLDAILSGYQEAGGHRPTGSADRLGLHQLFPLLVHVVLFGAGYAGQAVVAARSVLRLAHGLP
jgi:fructosamine-3-kinase